MDDQDVLLGEIGGCPSYIGKAQYKYWQPTQLIIDVVPGRGTCSTTTFPPATVATVTTVPGAGGGVVGLGIQPSPLMAWAGKHQARPPVSMEESIGSVPTVTWKSAARKRRSPPALVSNHQGREKR